MRYCLTYQKNKDKLMDKADEISIYFDRTDVSLVDFLKKYINKRIIINIEIRDFTNEDFKLLKALYEKYPNFALKFSGYDKKFIELSKEAHIPYFLSKLVNNWDAFYGLIELGVSDIYIVEELCFELDLCRPLATAANVKLRTFANVAQAGWSNIPDMKKFFIRPEDVIQYEPYLDTLELITNEVRQEEVLYSVYAEDKQWYGPLKEIINDFTLDIDNRFIVPRFAENRIRCGKKCLKGGSCELCETIEHLAETLKKQGIVVKTKKEEEE